MAKRKAGQKGAPGEQPAGAAATANKKELVPTSDTTVPSNAAALDAQAAPAPSKRQKHNIDADTSPSVQKEGTRSIAEQDNPHEPAPADSGVVSQPEPPAQVASESLALPVSNNSIPEVAAPAAIGATTSNGGSGRIDAGNPGPIASDVQDEKIKPILNKAKETTTKKVPKTKAKAASKASGRTKAKQPAVNGPNEAPKPKRINKIMKAKIALVKEFIGAGYASVLSKSPTNEAHTIVSESMLMGALMAMHVDYDISEDASWASLLDVEDCVVDDYEASIGTDQISVRHFVIDLAKRTSFEEGIQQKIQGHDLQDVNLLQIQLEVHTRLLEIAMVDRLLTACRAVFDGNDLQDLTEGYETVDAKEETQPGLTVPDDGATGGGKNTGEAQVGLSEQAKEETQLGLTVPDDGATGGGKNTGEAQVGLLEQAKEETQLGLTEPDDGATGGGKNIGEAQVGLSEQAMGKTNKELDQHGVYPAPMQAV